VLHHAEELAAERQLEQKVEPLLVLVDAVQRHDERVVELVERLLLAL